MSAMAAWSNYTGATFHAILNRGVKSMAANYEPILTIADLEAIPEDGNRYELIEGELFVSRAPSLKHQVIVSNINKILSNYLDQYPIGLVVPGPGVMFSNISG